MCFVNRVCRVKHTDHKVRFWSVRLHGALGPFGGDLVVLHVYLQRSVCGTGGTACCLWVIRRTGRCVSWGGRDCRKGMGIWVQIYCKTSLHDLTSIFKDCEVKSESFFWVVEVYQ